MQTVVVLKQRYSATEDRRHLQAHVYLQTKQ